MVWVRTFHLLPGVRGDRRPLPPSALSRSGPSSATGFVSSISLSSSRPDATLVGKTLISHPDHRRLHDDQYSARSPSLRHSCSPLVALTSAARAAYPAGTSGSPELAPPYSRPRRRADLPYRAIGSEPLPPPALHAASLGVG